MKIRLIILFLFIIFNYSFSQNIFKSKRIYIYRGYGGFSDFILSPITLVPQYDIENIGNDLNNNYNEIIKHFNGKYEERVLGGVGLLTLSYRIRYNITEFNKNSSFSLSFHPTFGTTYAYGVYSSDYGFGHINLPIYLEYNIGNNASYSHTSNIGMAVGFGNELMIFPLLIFYGEEYSYEYREYIEYKYKRIWLQPTIEFGFRFSGRSGNSWEILLNGGFGKKVIYLNEFNEKILRRPMILKLTLFPSIVSNNYKSKRNEDIEF